jgi:hypothetical protein
MTSPQQAPQDPQASSVRVGTRHTSTRAGKRPSDIFKGTTKEDRNKAHQWFKKIDSVENIVHGLLFQSLRRKFPLQSVGQTEELFAAGVALMHIQKGGF